MQATESEGGIIYNIDTTVRCQLRPPINRIIYGNQEVEGVAQDVEGLLLLLLVQRGSRNSVSPFTRLIRRFRDTNIVTVDPPLAL